MTNETNISIRDYIATHALQGLLASPQIKGNAESLDEWPKESLAKYAYELADAMIKARGECKCNVQPQP